MDLLVEFAFGVGSFVLRLSDGPVSLEEKETKAPVQTEAEAFTRTFASTSVLYSCSYVDKYIAVGAFVLLARAKIAPEDYKLYICSAALLAWYQLEDSFALLYVRTLACPSTRQSLFLLSPETGN